MHIVRAVIQGVGVPVELRYRMMGDALKVRADLESLHASALRVDDGIKEKQFTDDYGMTTTVYPYSVLLTQTVDHDKAVAADARNEVKRQVEFGKCAEAAVNGPAIIQPPGANGRRMV